MREMVELDGELGEGGGQILRSALSLSLITRRPFRIRNIRARRSPSGLRPQHLACVRGAELLSQGRAEGAAVGAAELTFEPGAVAAGDYLLEVGTAGSTPLLFQCLYFPLALAGGGALTLRGGTHLPHSPVFSYLAQVWLPMLRRYGLQAQVQLRYAGFYPEGAGEWVSRVAPAAPPPSGTVEWLSRGNLKDVNVTSMVAGLAFDVAERQGRATGAALREHGIVSVAQNLPLATTRSQGSAVFLRAEFEHSVAGFTALGERGKRAEAVGREAASALAEFMESSGAVDAHLADQLILPAALHAAGLLPGGATGTTVFTTARVTEHLRTNAAVLQRFLPTDIAISEEGVVRVAPQRG